MPLVASTARGLFTPAQAQSAPFDRSIVRQMARDAAGKPFKASDSKLPDHLNDLDYDHYRAETVGSSSLWLGKITLPAGKRTRAHVHEHHETALYMLSGDEMELWTGDQLQYRDIVRPGDYMFVPANMLHVAVNRSAQPAVFIRCRNEATAQESVVLRPEMDCKVP